MTTVARQQRTRIVVVDDHAVVRAGLVDVLEGWRGFTVVASAGTAAEAMAAVARHRPDVAVVDLKLPDLSGTELCRRLREQEGGPRVLVYTGFSHRDHAVEAFRAGADGFVTKSGDLDLVRRAVLAVASGLAFVDPVLVAGLLDLATEGLRHNGPNGLSMQERRVLERVAQGRTNGQVAGDLGLSPETVRTHLRRAMRKLGATDRQQAALLALKDSPSPSPPAGDPLAPADPGQEGTT